MNSAELAVVNNNEVPPGSGLNQESPSELSLKKVMGVELHPATLKDKFLYATFQIIAEQGADGLSANELIRKTDSSKGALFHHFKTLDDLCLESLSYFRRNARLSVVKPHSNIEECLKAFVEDITDRFANKSYFHIVHFFRDRALKNEKFQTALNDLYAVYVENFVDQIMLYMSAQADRDKVRELVIFLYMTLERLAFRYASSTEESQTSDVVNWYLKMMEDKFKEFKA